MAIKTPRARKSRLIFKKPKKATKLRMAPKASKLPICPSETAAKYVSLMLKSEKINMYNIIMELINTHSTDLYSISHHLNIKKRMWNLIS